MPEFANNDPAEWFNTKPSRRDDLRGKVILIAVNRYVP